MTLRPIFGRFRLQIVFSALVICALAVPLAAPPPALAADAGLVIEAMRVLQANHYRSAEPVKILNAAISSLRANLSTAGATVELPEIALGTSDADAQRQFGERFSIAVTAGTSVGLTPTQLAYQAIRGMTESYQDSHTGFLTPEQNRERRQRQRGEAGYTGVGVVLTTKDAKFYVRVVIPGGPADEAGIKDFDRILKVNEVSTGGLAIDQVSNLVRGPAGTVVTLTLQRAGVSSPLIIPITRSPIRLPAIYREQILGGAIGYVQLSQLNEGSGREFRAAVTRLRAQGMRALIIDLRANAGGFLRELDSVLNAILPPGVPIYAEIRSGGTRNMVRTVGVPVIPPEMPLMVLIDEGTASAAELLAAAVQESKRGTLVGVKTAGAVLVSMFLDLSDGSALSVAVFEILTGRGVRLESTGVKPDVLAALTTFDFDAGQDHQLGWAVRLMKHTLAQRVTP